MIHIPMKTRGAWNKDTLRSMNGLKTGQIVHAGNIAELQRSKETSPVQKQDAGKRTPPDEASGGHMTAPPSRMRLPALERTILKGQKIALSSVGELRQVDVCLGWNSKNAECDVDVSAFLLGENGKVIGDDWFVFYGQTKSPDGSTVFEVDGKTDREVIRMDLTRLHPAVKKVVFVLTINEAFEKKLNFGMLEDAYIRILEHGSQKELASFAMTDYYANVISMMIGELYLHGGNWKFHGIGNGVAKDLAGLCGLYGVAVS